MESTATSCATAFLTSYAQTVANDLMKTNFETLGQIAESILATKQTGNTIFTAGNGGSAATASHMANDLLKGARVLGREGFRAVCLADSTPIVTCLANDFAYEDIYSIQLRTFAKPGDLFVVYSGSGNSPNVVKGAITAKEMGLTTIAFGGRDGGQLKKICDYTLIAPTNSMEQLEDMHMLYEHALVSWFQKALPDVFDIETIHYHKSQAPTSAILFDFDGTLSLIRQGWREVMIPYFCEVLGSYTADTAQVEKTVSDFVDLLTGKQTIYQCIRLSEEVKKLAGVPLAPIEYKQEYHRRLLTQIGYRIEDLKAGRAKPEDYLVPGAIGFLRKLKNAGCALYLASGTDEPFVLEEAGLLGLREFFGEEIHGAREDYKTFSKAKVIERILETKGLSGQGLVGFGDGYVEMENVKAVGGYAVGVATDEVRRKGINQWKRNRLLEAGADAIIPDFSNEVRLCSWLFR